MTTERARSWERLLHACAILTLCGYLSGSTGPLIVHCVHLLHHITVLQDHIHIEESDHRRGPAHSHGADPANTHTHGDLIDHAVIWSNASANEDRTVHTVQDSRFSLHLPLTPFSPPGIFNNLSPLISGNDREEGRLRPEPPTPPPRLGLPGQLTI